MHPASTSLHGKVVIDGVTEIRSGVVIGPFVSIGLISGNILGPTIEEDVMVGANSSVLGKLTVGRGRHDRCQRSRVPRRAGGREGRPGGRDGRRTTRRDGKWLVLRAMFFRSRRGPRRPNQKRAQAEGRSTEELIEELESLTRKNQERPDAETEVKLVELRHAVGIRRLDEAQKGAAYPEPAFDRLPDRNGDLAGIEPAELSPEVLRAGILRDGCLLIRGAVDRDAALALAEGIDRAFQAREKAQANFSPERANPWGRREKAERMYYSEFTPTPRFRKALSRDWIQGGGGLWVADSPHLLFEMLQAFDRAGLGAAIRGYLGEPPLITVQKCTLRKVDPDAGRGWHQDGAFMGDVRALNVWLSLSHCGDDEAPGMDVVPRRLDGILDERPGGHGLQLVDLGAGG